MIYINYNSNFSLGTDKNNAVCYIPTQRAELIGGGEIPYDEIS